jgi:WD40 repeat protein
LHFYDGTIKLWDVPSLEPRGALFIGQAVQTTSVAFSPDGRMLASAHSHGEIVLWDVTTGEQLEDPLTTPGDYDYIYGLSFSPDGKTLASSGSVGGVDPTRTRGLDDAVLLWDVASRQPIGDPLLGHDAEIQSVAFSPDGKTVASAGGGTVILWDVTSEQPLGTPFAGYNGGMANMTFSPDGKMLASSSSDHAVMIWNLGTDHMLSTILDAPHSQQPSVAFSPDGETLVTAAFANRTDPEAEFPVPPIDGTLTFWDVASRQSLGDPILVPDSIVNSVALSRDGALLATGGSDLAAGSEDESRQDATPNPSVGAVILWDVASRQPVGEPMVGQGPRVIDVSFNTDGTLVASSGADNSIVLWDVASRQPLQPPLVGHPSDIRDIAISPDGTTLASVSCDKLGESEAGCHNSEIRLWDVASRLPRGEPRVVPGESMTSIAFNPDGTVLATGLGDSTVMVWDVEHLQLVETFRGGRASGVNDVAFSADGTTLAVGHGDATVQLWDVPSRQLLGVLSAAHGGPILDVEMSPNGLTLAAAATCHTGDALDRCINSEVRVWDLDPASWRARACDLAGRNLTREEWRRYLGEEEPYRATCGGQYPLEPDPALATPGATAA